MINEAIPPHVGIPLAAVLWLIAVPPRRLLCKLGIHRWTTPLSTMTTVVRECATCHVEHHHNTRGVRICADSHLVWYGRRSQVEWCDLYHGHPGSHYSIDADRSWPR